MANSFHSFVGSLVRHLAPVAVLGGVCFLACSSDNLHGLTGDHRSGGGSSTAGGGIGAGNGFGGSGSSAGFNGTGAPDGGGPPLVACGANMPCGNGQVCVAKDGAGVCSVKGAAGTDDSQCQNDTYC